MSASKVNIKQILAFHFLLHDRGKKFVVYGGAAGGGKSWLGCEWLMRCGWAFPGTRWFVGRNNIKDSRESVLVTFCKVARHYGFEKEYTVNDSGIKFKNGSEVILLDLTFYPKKDPMFERLGSKEYTGGWIEEAGEVHYLAFEVLKSRIGRHLNAEYGLEPKMLITCNPKKNWLYKQFYKPWKDGSLSEDSAFVSALVYDNPFITEDYIATLKSITSKQTRMRLLMGWWEYEDNKGSLVDYDAIMDAFSNPVQPDTDKRVRRMTADLALKGRDRFIIWDWFGPYYVRLYKSIPYCDAKQAENTLGTHAAECGVSRSNICADSDGLGQYLSAYLTGITEFHGGESANNSIYFNFKSECAFKLAEVIQNRQIRIECPDDLREAVAEEIEACLVMYDVDADTSKKRIISKEDQKALLGHSPDFFDGLMMGMSYEVKAPGYGSYNISFNHKHRTNESRRSRHH